jgi:glycosyltransferase involved in cell wall biosynthesis
MNMNKKKLSVVLAVYNEEKNLGDCLASVQHITDDIVIVDGSSTDATVSIAKKYGAHVVVTDNPPIFHINKQKAIDLAKHEWILQLDADERVSPELGEEMMLITAMSDEEIAQYQKKLPKRSLFLRHQRLLEQRDGALGTSTGSYNAFFIPRLNYFLGKYLRHGGVYPDGVIRLIRKGKAYLPCKDVHEQMAVDGRVGWLENDLYHIDSPTFKRYIERNGRYVSLMATELKKTKKNKTFYASVQYLLYLPAWWFIVTYGRHKGFQDGWPGFVFSFFSALRFPKAYIESIKGIV